MKIQSNTFLKKKILIAGWLDCLFFVGLAKLLGILKSNLKYLRTKLSQTYVHFNILAEKHRNKFK